MRARSTSLLLFVPALALGACDRGSSTATATADAAVDAQPPSEAHAMIEFEKSNVVVRARRVVDDKVVAEAVVVSGAGEDSLRLAQPESGEPTGVCIGSRDFGNQIFVLCLGKGGARLEGVVTLQKGVLAVSGKDLPANDGSIVTVLHSRLPLGDPDKLQARVNRDTVERRCRGVERNQPLSIKVRVGRLPEAGADALLFEMTERNLASQVFDGNVADCHATASPRGVVFRCGSDAGPSRFADVYTLGNTLFIDRNEDRSMVELDCQAKVVFDPKAICQTFGKAIASCEVEASK